MSFVEEFIKSRQINIARNIVRSNIATIALSIGLLIFYVYRFYSLKFYTNYLDTTSFFFSLPIVVYLVIRFFIVLGFTIHWWKENYFKIHRIPMVRSLALRLLPICLIVVGLAAIKKKGKNNQKYSFQSCLMDPYCYKEIASDVEKLENQFLTYCQEYMVRKLENSQYFKNKDLKLIGSKFCPCFAENYPQKNYIYFEHNKYGPLVLYSERPLKYRPIYYDRLAKKQSNKLKNKCDKLYENFQKSSGRVKQDIQTHVKQSEEIQKLEMEYRKNYRDIGCDEYYYDTGDFYRFGVHYSLAVSIFEDGSTEVDKKFIQAFKQRHEKLSLQEKELSLKYYRIKKSCFKNALLEK